jgi:hypothetical protein
MIEFKYTYYKIMILRYFKYINELILLVKLEYLMVKYSDYSFFSYFQLRFWIV